jgi:hypothetical protein
LRDNKQSAKLGKAHAEPFSVLRDNKQSAKLGKAHAGPFSVLRDKGKPGCSDAAGLFDQPQFAGEAVVLTGHRSCLK